VTIRYTVTIGTAIPQRLSSVAQLEEAGTGTSTGRVTVVANPLRTYLPLVAGGR
jgi:hypothetical protein